MKPVISGGLGHLPKRLPILIMKMDREESSKLLGKSLKQLVTVRTMFLISSLH